MDKWLVVLWDGHEVKRVTNVRPLQGSTLLMCDVLLDDGSLGKVNVVITKNIWDKREKLI